MRRTSLVTRRRAAATATAAAAIVLAGCSTQSPSTITKPYDAADGVSAELADGAVGLRNMLVVGDEKGGRGVVLGSIYNEGQRAVTVSLTSDLAEGANPAESRIRVPALGAVQLGAAGQTPVVIDALPVPPGGVVKLSAATSGGGTVELSAPVLPQTGYYASYTAPAPTATPSPSVTGSASAAPTPGASAGQDLEATPTEEPTATP